MKSVERTKFGRESNEYRREECKVQNINRWFNERSMNWDNEKNEELMWSWKRPEIIVHIVGENQGELSDNRCKDNLVRIR